MKTTEWKNAIQNGTSAAFARLYGDDPTAVSRFTEAITAFEE